MCHFLFLVHSRPKEPNYKCEHTLKAAFTSSNKANSDVNRTRERTKSASVKAPFHFLALWEKVEMLKLLRKPNKLNVLNICKNSM